MLVSPNLFSFYFTITLLVILIVFILKYFIKIYRRDPRLVQFAETIPGPPESSIFGSFADFVYGEDSLKKAARYFEKYGHIYKLWFGKHLVVGLSKLEDLEVVFMCSKMLGKPEMFAPFHDFWGDGLFTASVDIWKKNRKKLTSAFGNNRFERYTAPINEKTSNAIEIIRNQVDGPEFNIWNHLSFLSFDIISKLMLNVELSWGHPLSTQFHQSMAKGLQISYERMCIPWFHVKFISDFYYKKQITDIKTKILQFSKKILDDKMSYITNEILLHKENPDKIPADEIPPKSFLTSAYELLNEGYDEHVVHDEIINIISGGTNTTASMLGFFLLAVAIHQDVQVKIYDELYEIFGDSDRDAEFEDIKRLPYFDQVLKEALRRFPLVPFVLRGVQEDCKIGDRVFPAGTTIMVSIGAVHFNPQFYPDPWKFNPDNFSPAAVQNRPKLAYIPFSVGARNCIGQNYAIFELKLILSTLLRKFSFHTTMTMNDIKLNTGFVIDVLNGYNLSLKTRVRKPSYF
ncbi:cytochrome P450 4C1-like isoform X2 [Planococcus citri]|uniref:cytochrome P450 4C1-like isoform X2 n=1 Tax=Planococcus citri TaxID=170843 RepID=UPI0031F9D731